MALSLVTAKEFMDAHYDEIVEFAELKDFMNMPIKNYSSGMAARLGFAIATIVQPEILIVDEVLAVGDAAFQEKCQERMHHMLENGTTLCSSPIRWQRCGNSAITQSG